MKRLILPIALLALATGCNKAPETKDAIRAGVVEHLKKNSGLDLNSMAIEVTDVTFKGSEAVAKVNFKPNANPNDGMGMTYTLERQGKLWAVKAKGNSEGGSHSPGVMPPLNGPSSSGGGDLPAGHPPVGGASGGTGQLPAGHPPVAGQGQSGQTAPPSGQPAK